MNLEKKFLTINEFSRPGKHLIGVKGIVIHWVANPKTSAMFNRNFFESLKDQKTPTVPGVGNLKENVNHRYASAHFIIGLDGEIIQCLDETEMAYHVGALVYTKIALQKLSAYPNNCTLGIELCHPDWTGKFTDTTLQVARELILVLCEKYHLGRADVYRHFDVTSKECPLYFVKNPAEWENFLNSIFKK
jgi:N-acetylmuramoyl-L-alanine amidase